MRFLLDTNIVIFATLAEGDTLRARMSERGSEEMVTSSIVIAEVMYGSARGKPPALNRLTAFLEEVPVLAFDQAAAAAYATLPLRRAGYDRLIAAHALALGLVVVTANEADFADIPGLRVENWTQ